MRTNELILWGGMAGLAALIGGSGCSGDDKGGSGGSTGTTTAVATTSTTTSTTASTSTGSDPPVELTITDFNVQADPTGDCQPCGAVEFRPCGDYRMGFTLTNTSDKAMRGLDHVWFGVEFVSAQTDGGTEEEGIECNTTPWRLEPGASSGFSISYERGGLANSYCMTFYTNCGDSQVKDIFLQPQNFSATGQATMELEGSLYGGSWFATASAMLTPAP